MKRNQKRQRIKRVRKPVMLVMGEGNYATERMYLRHFTGREYSYCLKFGNSGGYTDEYSGHPRASVPDLQGHLSGVSRPGKNYQSIPAPKSCVPEL